MKVLISVTFLLGAASAGFIGHQGYTGNVAAITPLAYARYYENHYTGPQHISVIGHNGVPLDTPEVVAARANHAAAHAEAAAHDTHGAIAPVVYSDHEIHDVHHYTGPQHIPVIGPHGVPLDTPEVDAGKAANAAFHAEAKARNGGYHQAGHQEYVYGIAPVAHGAVTAVAHNVHHYSGPQHIPVIGPHGVPLDTPEVAAGKAANAAFHAEAHARNGDYHLAGHHAYAYGFTSVSHGAAASVEHAVHRYTGPQHIPVIGPHGVPLDTPEVAAGKAANPAFHAEAQARNGNHHFASHH